MIPRTCKYVTFKREFAMWSSYGSWDEKVILDVLGWADVITGVLTKGRQERRCDITSFKDRGRDHKPMKAAASRSWRRRGAGQLSGPISNCDTWKRRMVSLCVVFHHWAVDTGLSGDRRGTWRQRVTTTDNGWQQLVRMETEEQTVAVTSARPTLREASLLASTDPFPHVFKHTPP